MTRPVLHTDAPYSPAAVDKVEHLLEVLAAIDDDSELRPALVLHGGTALNVFLAELPRLSVDLDLMYVGAADRDAMLERRPSVDHRLRRICGSLGYSVRGTNDEHSGQTYRLG